MEFAGEFEIHVTLELPEKRRAETLRDWAGRRGLKFTHIELAQGASASQPMVTRHGRGTLLSELAHAKLLAARLQEDGFAVVRVKLEASPENEQIPQTDEDIVLAPPERYFEH